jgi:hypothetical protein
MTREELAAHAAKTIALAQSRFLGVGADQYQISEDEQSFERSSIPTMLRGLREELIDTMNYITMLDILIQRRLVALGEPVETGEDYVTALNRECDERWAGIPE